MIVHNLRICNSDFKKNSVSFAHFVYNSSVKCQHDVVAVCLFFTGFVCSKEEF